MSGFSDGTTCPNCGGEADSYTDRKPFDYTSITCIHCGLTIGPHLEYMDLEELNERREQEGLDPLTELPKQDEEIW